MKVTIQDVAREAGVSITTVSRVVNNNYPVSKAAREKVEAAIEKLNFNPNLLARSLINSKTNTVGVLIPSITNLFFPSVVKGIEIILRDSGYIIYLCDTDNNEEEEIKQVKSLLARQVDGLIVIDPSTSSVKNGFYENISKQRPLVLVNGYNKGISCNFILNDEESGAIEAMEYLISLGHTNISFIRGEKSYSYDLKEEVYKNIMAKYNLKNKINIINIGHGNKDETTEKTSDRITKDIKSQKYSTAYFACNDLMALGAINAFKKENINVPEEVSVVGFDNIVISSLVQPKITTVDQNMFDLGKNAARMLMDAIQNKNKPIGKIILQTKLVIRESCEQL